MKETKVYAVTGVYHGSIVEAHSNTEARKLFQKCYNGEKILMVKNITTHNLINL